MGLVDRGTRVFWAIVAILTAASLFFTLGAEQRRRGVVDKEAELHNGDVVQFQQVVDGDAVLLAKDGQTVSVRVLGVKAFSSSEKGASGRYGQEARLRLERELENQSIQVLLNEASPRDPNGRYLAELLVDDRNVGLDLVKRGLVLVYSKYPFPTISIYLQAQEQARSEKKGLWADPDTAKRARLLSQSWREQGQ